MGGKQHSADAELRYVLRQYSLPVDNHSLITTGLVHRSYVLLDAHENPVGVAQRLHQAFRDAVNSDVDAVTSYLAKQGLVTPVLVRNQQGAHSVIHNGHIWRILSYIDGVALRKFSSPFQARSAGQSLGKLHRALEDFAHKFEFHREIHNTTAHLRTLEQLSTNDSTHEAAALARDILSAASKLPPIEATNRRILHGDPKRSNLLFRKDDPMEALCFIDLDGVGPHQIAYELGDALRSWCATEHDNTATFDPDLFRAALAGYRGEYQITPAENRSIIAGLQTVCVELSARFCADAFEDRYFGWDPARYKSRVAHNLARARSQLQLATLVSKLYQEGAIST